MGAILNTVIGISAITATLIPQGVKGTIAKHAVEAVDVTCFMTGEIFTGSVLEKSMIRFHAATSHLQNIIA